MNSCGYGRFVYKKIFTFSGSVYADPGTVSGVTNEKTASEWKPLLES